MYKKCFSESIFGKCVLRRALLTFGDYTLKVGNSNYQTLCVDNPNDNHAPSLKKLFSEHAMSFSVQNTDSAPVVKKLLDRLNANNNIDVQLGAIIDHSQVSANDWRYCFIKFPQLFDRWKRTPQGLLYRLYYCRKWIIVPKQALTGRCDCYEVFSEALREQLLLKKLNVNDDPNDCGMGAHHSLYFKNLRIQFIDGQFTIMNNEDNQELYKTKTNDPIAEASAFLLSQE